MTQRTQTRLQNKVCSLYDSYSENFADNKDSLKNASDIVGNRAYSHLDRTKKINEIRNLIYDSLNNSEKEYFDQLLRTHQNYVKTTSRTREIKKSHEVRENIYAIRKDIRGSRLEVGVEKDSGDSLTKRAISGITDTVIPSETPGILEYSKSEDIENVVKPNFVTYASTKSKKSSWARAGFAYIPQVLGKVGSWIKKNAVAIGAAGLMGIGGFGIGHHNSNAKIDELTKQNLSLETKIEQIGDVNDITRRARVGMVSEEEYNKFKTTTEQKYDKTIKELCEELTSAYEENSNLKAQLGQDKTNQDITPARVACSDKSNFIEKNYWTEERKAEILARVKPNRNTGEYARNFDSQDFQRNRAMGPGSKIKQIPQYQKDGFFTYADEFGKKNNENFCKGPLEFILGIGGIAYQGVIIANKTAEAILTPPAQFVGGELGLIGNIAGNPDACAAKGAEDGRMFVKRVGANTWGGRSLTDADGNLLASAGCFLTLQPKKGVEHLGRGIAIPSEQEQGIGNKVTAETVYVLSHILPFLDYDHDHGHHGASSGGGRVREGPGVVIDGGSRGGGAGLH